MNELWDLYDENRRVLGKTIRRGDAVPPDTYHILAAVWTVNSSGQLLITRRSPEKFYCPNCWENTGGAVLSGETSRQAAARELREETGIDVSPEDFFLLTTTKEKRFFTDTYLLFTDIPPRTAAYAAGRNSGSALGQTRRNRTAWETGCVRTHRPQSARSCPGAV